MVTWRPTAFDALPGRRAAPISPILVYPVISFTHHPYAQWFHVESAGQSARIRRRSGGLSNELQVTPQTPPAFLFHTTGDTVVPSENSVLYYLALRKAGVKAEMHIYQEGQHGVGLAQSNPVLSTWPGLLKQWLALNSWVPQNAK